MVGGNANDVMPKTMPDEEQRSAFFFSADAGTLIDWSRLDQHVRL